MTRTSSPRTLWLSDPAMPIAPTLGLVGRREHHCGDCGRDGDLQDAADGVSQRLRPVGRDGRVAAGRTLCRSTARCAMPSWPRPIPRSGGDYHYLTKAFGRWMGFLFGWAQLAVILTGSIGSMAYAFADYGVQLWGAKPGETSATLWLAAGSIVVLSVMNLLGVVVGKSVQNWLSVVKILGLVGIFVAAVLCSSRGSLASPGTIEGPGLGLALVFVLYAYGGWSDAAFVAAEVRGRQRNLPLALFLGIGLITVIYLLVILAYMVVLGFDGARESETPAADVMQLVVGDWGRSSSADW